MDTLRIDQAMKLETKPLSCLADRTKLELKTVNTGNEADLGNIPVMS